MNNDFQQQGTQPPQAAPIPQATPMPQAAPIPQATPMPTAQQTTPIPQAAPMPTAQQTAVPPPPAQFNPNFQNQFGGGGSKPISKDLSKISENSAAASPVANPGNSNANTLLRRAEIMISSGDFENAKSYLQRFLDQDPENGWGYFNLILAALKLTDRKMLVNFPYVRITPNFKLAEQFADDELKEVLNQILHEQDEIKRKAEEEQRRLAEEQRKAEEERRRLEEEKAAAHRLRCIDSKKRMDLLEKQISLESGLNGWTELYRRLQDCVANEIRVQSNPDISDSELAEIATLSQTTLSECGDYNIKLQQLQQKRKKQTKIGLCVLAAIALIVFCCFIPTIIDHIRGYETSNGILVKALDRTRTEFEIHDGVTTIGAYAFSGCSNLKSITIPNSVTTIGDKAFNRSGLNLAYIPKNCVVSKTAFDSNVQLIRLANEDYKTLESAEKGNAEAQYRIGKIYSDHKVYDTAVEWYRKSADQGNAYAQYELGKCYEKGLGVAKDLEKASELWKRAVEGLKKVAEQGEPEAQYILGLCYQYGRGIPKDIAKAVEWYRKSADQGFARAQTNLGVCYYNGQGVTRDYSKAVEWWQKAADQGDDAAQRNMGLCYQYGIGVQKDITKAVEWYRKSAEQGCADAQCDLAMCYSTGQGVQNDFAKAVEWWQKSADQGYAQAQAVLGVLYATGQGVPKDLAKAVEWYRKAADQGHAKAQFALGQHYEYGDGVPNDFAKAVEWYRKAADQGLAEAQFALGSSYQKGEGVQRNLAKAVEWYRKAADQGHAAAMGNLGMCYYLGLGVPKDIAKSNEWYRKAADRGHVKSQCMLALHYEKGIGVPKSLVEALKWYRKAAEQGETEAKTRAERIEAELKAEAERKQFEAQVKALGPEELTLPGGIKLEMVKIPAGSFQRYRNTVTLTKPFYLGKFEVTQAQWEAVMGSNPSYFKGDDLPVTVSWLEAKEFCKKLNEIYANKLPAGYQFDLPTDAQWEYACRAGTTTDFNNGKDLTSDYWEMRSILDEVAWYGVNSGNKPHEVGQKRANAWGLYDMHGNVREWCRDWEGYYPYGSVSDPVGPSSGLRRVVRGGGCIDSGNDCRSGAQSYSDPSYRSDGFRLALVPIQ